MDSTLRSCAEYNKIGIGFTLDFENFLGHVAITNNVFRLARVFGAGREKVVEEVFGGGDRIGGGYMVPRFLLRDHVQKNEAGLKLVCQRSGMSHNIAALLVRRTQNLAERDG